MTALDASSAPKDPRGGGHTGLYRRDNALEPRPDGNRLERRAWKKLHPVKQQEPRIVMAHQWRDSDDFCVIHDKYDKPADWRPA
jgi:hypothetical protein